MVNLNIKILDESARRYYEKSEVGYKGDAGFDLYFPEQHLVCAYETALDASDPANKSVSFCSTPYSRELSSKVHNL